MTFFKPIDEEYTEVRTKLETHPNYASFEEFSNEMKTSQNTPKHWAWMKEDHLILELIVLFLH